MPRQTSQLGYSTGRPAFGGNNTPVYSGYQNQPSFNHGFNMTPSHGGRDNNDGIRQRQIGYRDNDRVRTPSPSKGRKFV
jgi:hypothetical protein